MLKDIIYIMDENDPLSEYNKIPLGHNHTNGAVDLPQNQLQSRSALHLDIQ